MKICYIEKRFSSYSKGIIKQANSIIDEYQAAGFTLTLRQLYYQFVARGLIDNQTTEYKRLGSIINDARLAGLIDWAALEDRTRNLAKHSAWSSPQQILKGAAQSYAIDMWENQPNYCEVWVEKEALNGVIQDACAEHRVPSFACRGYTSQSEQWAAGQRLARMAQGGQVITIFHLGDHDPSGIDMTRDNTDRLEMFISKHCEGYEFHFIRLALNMDQVEKYSPPTKPGQDYRLTFPGILS
jgi:hypothetical protein